MQRHSERSIPLPVPCAGETRAAFGEGELDVDWIRARLGEHEYDDHIMIEYSMDYDPGLVSANALLRHIENRAKE